MSCRLVVVEKTVTAPSSHTNALEIDVFFQDQWIDPRLVAALTVIGYNEQVDLVSMRQLVQGIHKPDKVVIHSLNSSSRGIGFDAVPMRVVIDVLEIQRDEMRPGRRRLIKPGNDLVDSFLGRDLFVERVPVAWMYATNVSFCPNEEKSGADHALALGRDPDGLSAVKAAVLDGGSVAQGIPALQGGRVKIIFDDFSKFCRLWRLAGKVEQSKS